MPLVLFTLPPVLPSIRKMSVQPVAPMWLFCEIIPSFVGMGWSIKEEPKQSSFSVLLFSGSFLSISGPELSARSAIKSLHLFIKGIQPNCFKDLHSSHSSYAVTGIHGALWTEWPSSDSVMIPMSSPVWIPNKQIEETKKFFHKNPS